VINATALPPDNLRRLAAVQHIIACLAGISKCFPPRHRHAFVASIVELRGTL
jgi:hypothetical protein